MKKPTKGYEVLRTFVASYGGVVYSGVKGDVKPLPVEVAEWIERDSPGRLRAVDEDGERDDEKNAEGEALTVAKRRAVLSGRDRMVREGRDR